MASIAGAYQDIVTVRPIHYGSAGNGRVGYFKIARYRATLARDGHMYWKFTSAFPKGGTAYESVKCRAMAIASSLNLEFKEHVCQFDWVFPEEQPAKAIASPP